MADPQRIAPSPGLLHVRARHTKNFTILPNHLIQRTGSAVTAGVAAYLFSQRDGTVVSIDRLCAHFAEGRVRISRALTELEAAGYLERRLERAPDGTLRTRVILHDQPAAKKREPAPRSGPRPVRATSTRGARPAPRDSGAPDTGPAGDRRPAAPIPPVHPAPAVPAPPPAPEPTRSSPEADRFLASLRVREPRLFLSEDESRRLAPEVDVWLCRGATFSEIARALTTGLPVRFTGRPYHLLRYRLRAFLPARWGAQAGAPRPGGDGPAPPPAGVVPLRTCARCDNVAFRSTVHSHCPACRAPVSGPSSRSPAQVGE
ncbi:translation initiation factor IF-2 [Streptomyces sp. ACA25]|uniref:translation initiation factor IF-2 n=1 Tax=Streptomyces sp. ACA25 TaxID=3022596 RepID=UPI00230730CF|nr:translation initiation factor IF-2 [Streptomyces sp. ACA25]MDB1088524.1 translation initiation factor IF-2 [Streptomyces sp. ACA25]